MMKTAWVIGAVVVVGAGIAAGLFLLGGRQPDAVSSDMPSQDVLAETAAVISATPAEELVDDATAIAANSEVDPEEPPAAAEQSNEADDEAPVMIDSLDDLFANAAAYSGKQVVARGTIVTQCISGCTFSLEDGTGVVAVDLVDDALDNVLERGSVGRQVEVRGVVETSPQLVIVLEDPEDWNYID